MDLDDIPLPRHLALLASLLKAALLLLGLFLFPLMVLVRLCDLVLAPSRRARLHCGLQVLAWACAADAYCLLVIGMLANLCGYPGIADGRSWPHLLALLCSERGSGLVVGEVLLQAGLSLVLFALSWLFQSRNMT